MDTFTLIATLAIAAALGMVGIFAYRFGLYQGRELSKVREYERGYEAGHSYGVTAMRNAAEAALEAFPTSLGGRAIVKALGGTVPPITRKRTEEPEVGRE